MRNNSFLDYYFTILFVIGLLIGALYIVLTKALGITISDFWTGFIEGMSFVAILIGGCGISIRRVKRKK